MALVSIKIKELDNAKKYAGKARDEAEDYRDALYDKIITKMNSYSGSGSSYISTAKRLVNDKRSELSDKGDSFRTLGNDIGTLKTNIVNAETQLTNKIEQVVGNFCSKYDLKSERSFWEKLCDFLVPDDLVMWFKELKINYRYEGGKEKLNYIGKVLAEIGAVIGCIAAVIGVAAAIILSAGAVAIIGAIAGAVLAVIGLATAIVQTNYAAESYRAAADGDPIWGRRYQTHSDNETVVTELRRNERYGWARFVEITEVVATVTSIITSFINLGAGMKAAGGFKNYIKTGFTNIKNNFKLFKMNPGSTLSTLLFNGFKWSDFGTSLKTIKAVADVCKNGITIANNLLGIVDGVLDGKPVDAFVEFFGSTADMAISYLNDLASNDLRKDYFESRAEKYERRGNTDISNRWSKLAQSAEVRFKKLDIGKSIGDIAQSIAENLIDVTAKIQEHAINGKLTLKDFKYDNGERMTDCLKPFTSFEKLLPKIIDKLKLSGSTTVPVINPDYPVPVLV